MIVALVIYLYVVGCFLAGQYADEVKSNNYRFSGIIIYVGAWPIVIPLIWAFAVIQVSRK